MSWLGLVLLVAATVAAVKVWFEGSLFDGRRAVAETWRLEDGETWQSASKLFLGELLGCRFCLTYQVSIWFTLVYLAVAAFPSDLHQLLPASPGAALYGVGCVAVGVIQGLAVAGLAWAVQQL